MAEDSVDIEALERLAGKLLGTVPSEISVKSEREQAGQAILSLIQRVREAEAEIQRLNAEAIYRVKQIRAMRKGGDNG